MIKIIVGVKLADLKPSRQNMRRWRDKVRRVLRHYLLWRYSWLTTSLGVSVVCLLVLLGINLQHSAAASATMVPDGDVTTAWSPSSGTTHYSLVDDGAANNTSDFVSVSSTNTTASVTDQYTLTSPTSVASASQIVLTMYMEAMTSANGGMMDSISLNLIVNGTAQTATTCTPSYSSWTSCTATFSGSWTQADVDSMQVSIVRNIQGSGSPKSQPDTVQVSDVYGNLTYVPSIQYTQSAYRWFENQDATQSNTFAKAYGTSDTDVEESVVPASDGGYVAAGYVGKNADDAVLSKYDSSGTLIWSKSWGGSSLDRANDVIQTSDGGYAVVGTTDSFGDTYGDAFLAKFTASGEMSWIKTWGTTTSLGSQAPDSGNSLVQTSDGGYAITGQDYSSNYVYVVKYDTSGNLLWSSTFLGGAVYSYGSSIIQTSDGGFAVTGRTGSSYNLMLCKLDSGGAPQWCVNWGGANNDEGYSLVQTSDGGYVISGITYSYLDSTNGDLLLVKFDSSGNFLWSQTWGASTSSDAGNSVALTSDGGFVVTGYTQSYGDGAKDIVLLKYDSGGNLKWNKTWGGASNDIGDSVIQTADGGFIVAGYTQSYGTGGDFVLLKYDANGSINNCNSPMCQDPIAITDSPSAASSPGTPSLSTMTTSVGTPLEATSDLSETTTVIVPGPPIDVGSPLTTNQDTAATAPSEGTIFRLRANIHVSGAQADAGMTSFKLQYADKGAAASCSAVPTTSFNDVTDSSDGIRYADNTNGVSGMGLTSNADDPIHSTEGHPVDQTYQEQGTTSFTDPTAIPPGEDGMWDFGLVAYHSVQNTDYCFRIVNSDGSPLSTYNVYPELTMPAASFQQASYRWYNPKPVGSNLTFAKAYDAEDINFNTNYVNVESVTQTSDGGYAETGYYGNYYYDVYIAKFDSSGNLSWAKTWGGSDIDEGRSIIQTSDGGYVIAGYYGAGSFNSDILLAKFDSSGNLSWAKTWGGTKQDEIHGMVQTSNGGFAVTGKTYSYGDTTNGDAFVATFDSSGNLSWFRTWGGTNTDSGDAITSTTDGGFAVTGLADGQSSCSGSCIITSQVFLVKFDSSGNLAWGGVWGGAGDDEGYAVTQTSDGGFAVSGTFSSDSSNLYDDSFIAKYDSAGNLSWAKTWGASGYDAAKDIIQTSDGGYAVTGENQVPDVADGPAYLAKFDASGNLSWEKTFGDDNGGTSGTSLRETSDGGYVVAGQTNEYGIGQGDTLLLKYDSSGNIADCPNTICQSVTPTLSPLSMTVTAAGTITAPTVTSGTPSATVGSLSLTTTIIVATPIDVGNALADNNKPLDLPSLTPLNLRVDVRVDESGIATNAQSFQLEYALKNDETNCAVVGSTSYLPVSTSTPIAYYDDSGKADDQPIADNPNDPTDGLRTNVAESYQESNPFTNNVAPIYAGEDGMWQFALIINNASLKGKDFCVRVAAQSGGVYSPITALNTADVAYAPTMQELLHGGNWFSRTTGTKQHLSL